MTLMAVVGVADRSRAYLSPTEELELVAKQAAPSWKPETPCRGTFASNAQGRIYGFRVFGDYFTPRQLCALSTFSDLVQEVVGRCRGDAVAAGMPDDDVGLSAGGKGACAYGEAIAVYLAVTCDKEAETLSSICIWSPAPKNELIMGTFRRQGLPMT
jgi:putative DNA methylase